MSVVSAVVSVLFAASTQVGVPVCADMVWSSRVDVLPSDHSDRNGHNGRERVPCLDACVGLVLMHLVAPC